MFFISWALWEQMTFVLGAAILAVFAIGYGKLIYSNRLLHKQEVVDEEKRMRIRELRSSGQIVESRKSHDVPFGVRAIQSGIQVDGIWISSQGSTPIPSDLKLDHLRTSTAEIDTSRISTESTSDPLRPLSRQGRSAFRATDSSNLNLDKVYEASDIERPLSAGTRASYKPRRSSHLRHGSHGQYDKETLSQLEGTSPVSKRKVYTHRPRSPRELEIEADSSAADNERSSSGASSDSETSLSHKLKGHTGSLPHSLLSEPDIRNATSLTFASILRKAIRKSLPAPDSKTECFSIPPDSPPLESNNAFETPLLSPGERTPGTENTPQTGRPGPLGDYQALPSQLSRSPSPFIPGELHVNKTVRKVNSGFEVLPAGTFGVPPEFKGKGLDVSEEDDVGDRRQSRLQKKTRTSMTGHISSTFERP